VLTTEKAELIDRILAHQRELSIPAETKTLRILRTIVTSTSILIAFALYRPLSLYAPPIVNLLAEVALAAGIAYLVSQAWPYLRKWTSAALPLGVVFARATLETMTLEELQGLEYDLRLQIQERDDRAFLSEETEDKIIGFGSFIVFCLASSVCYTIAMSMRGFGSVVLSLLFTFAGGVVAAGAANRYCAEPLRNVMRFFVRRREYIFYGALVLVYTLGRLSAK
jgi:hypothetical protein